MVVVFPSFCDLFFCLQCVRKFLFPESLSQNKTERNSKNIQRSKKRVYFSCICWVKKHLLLFWHRNMLTYGTKISCHNEPQHHPSQNKKNSSNKCESISAPRQLFTQSTKMKETQISATRAKEKTKECIYLGNCFWVKNPSSFTLTQKYPHTQSNKKERTANITKKPKKQKSAFFFLSFGRRKNCFLLLSQDFSHKNNKKTKAKHKIKFHYQQHTNAKAMWWPFAIALSTPPHDVPVIDNLTSVLTTTTSTTTTTLYVEGSNELVFGKNNKLVIGEFEKAEQRRFCNEMSINGRVSYRCWLVVCFFVCFLLFRKKNSNSLKKTRKTNKETKTTCPQLNFKQDMWDCRLVLYLPEMFAKWKARKSWFCDVQIWLWWMLRLRGSAGVEVKLKFLFCDKKTGEKKIKNKNQKELKNNIHKKATNNNYNRESGFCRDHNNNNNNHELEEKNKKLCEFHSWSFLSDFKLISVFCKSWNDAFSAGKILFFWFWFFSVTKRINKFQQ